MRRHRGGWVFASAVLAAVSVAAPSAAGPVIESTETVSVYVTVRDGCQAVPGLSERNFRVFENGQPQRVQAAAPSAPASLVLLVENTLSSFYFLDDARRALQGFLKAAPQDRSPRLITFSRYGDAEAGLKKEIDKVGAFYPEMSREAWKHTGMFDAVYRAVDEMARQPGRQILILIASGNDYSSRHTLGETLRKVESKNVPLYSVVTGSAFRSGELWYPDWRTRPDLSQGERLLSSLARASGGQVYCPSCEADYGHSIRDILQLLDSQYTLRYERLAAPGRGFRRLKVEAFRIENDHRHNFSVLVREGWGFDPRFGPD